MIVRCRQFGDAVQCMVARKLTYLVELQHNTLGFHRRDAYPHVSRGLCNMQQRMQRLLVLGIWHESSCLMFQVHVRSSSACRTRNWDIAARTHNRRHVRHSDQVDCASIGVLQCRCCTCTCRRASGFRPEPACRKEICCTAHACAYGMQILQSCKSASFTLPYSCICGIISIDSHQVAEGPSSPAPPLLGPLWSASGSANPA